MPPFRADLQPGESPYRQLVYAATRAIVAGELAPGAPFPSVRELSQSFRINPTTAHRVVAELIRDGLIQVVAGVGTLVSTGRRATAVERRQLLSREVEQLVVEAKRLGLEREDVVNAVLARWAQLFDDGVEAKPRKPQVQAEGSRRGTR